MGQSIVHVRAYHACPPAQWRMSVGCIQLRLVCYCAIACKSDSSDISGKQDLSRAMDMLLAYTCDKRAHWYMSVQNVYARKFSRLHMLTHAFARKRMHVHMPTQTHAHSCMDARMDTCACACINWKGSLVRRCASVPV
eukprot:6185214-Pleurochrysis_carterae.AAC.3